jgi:hypothetical protein
MSKPTEGMSEGLGCVAKGIETYPKDIGRSNLSQHRLENKVTSRFRSIHNADILKIECWSFTKNSTNLDTRKMKSSRGSSKNVLVRNVRGKKKNLLTIDITTTKMDRYPAILMLRLNAKYVKMNGLAEPLGSKIM